MKALQADQADVKKRQEIVGRMEIDLKQEVKVAQEHHLQQQAEYAKYVETLKNQELALVARAEKLEEEKTLLESQKLEVQTKTKAVNEKLTNLKSQEESLVAEREELSQMKASMARDIEHLKTEIGDRQVKFAAREAQIVTMEKRNGETCTQLLAVEKAYEEEKAQMNDQFEKHKQTKPVQTKAGESAVEKGLRKITTRKKHKRDTILL